MISIENRAMGKAEIADYYEITVRTLMTWINNNKKLKEELDKTGYYKTQKLFNPKQVAIIENYLGVKY